MHIVHAGYPGETKSYHTITKLTCYSYLVRDDGVSESSDTAEESAGGQKSDIDEHDDLSGTSGPEVEREEKMEEREESCDSHMPNNRDHNEGGSSGSTHNGKVVEIVAGTVSLNETAGVNEDIPEHGKPPHKTILL